MRRCKFLLKDSAATVHLLNPSSFAVLARKMLDIPVNHTAGPPVENFGFCSQIHSLRLGR
jgi:hypothetical protein